MSKREGLEDNHVSSFRPLLCPTTAKPVQTLQHSWRHTPRSDTEVYRMSVRQYIDSQTNLGRGVFETPTLNLEIHVHWGFAPPQSKGLSQLL